MGVTLEPLCPWSVRETGIRVFTVTVDGTVVGLVSVNAYNVDNMTFSAGVCIEEEHRNKGHGTAAMRVVMNMMFDSGYHKFFCDVIEGNVASTRMMLKLGCEREGFMPDMVVDVDGVRHGLNLWGLTNDKV